MKSFLRAAAPALIVAALGVVLMTAGVLRGEQNIVFIKASNLCMECIGLG